MRQSKRSTRQWNFRNGWRACLCALLWCTAATAQDDIIFIGTFEADFVPPPTCDGVSPPNFTQITNTTVYDGEGNTQGFRNVTTLRGLYGPLGVNSGRLYFRGIGGGYFAFAFTGQQLKDDFDKGAYNPGGQTMTAGGRPNAGFAYMTVSGCPGDFRLPAVVPPDDPWRRSPMCASNLAVGLTDNMISFIVADSIPPGAPQCIIDKTHTYYLNVVFADPRDGLQDNEIDCPPGVGACGTKFDIE